MTEDLIKRTARGTESTAVDASARALRTLTRQHLGELLERMLDGAEDTLFDQAGRAASNAEARLHFDAMRVVKLQRGALAKRFGEHLVEGFDQVAPPSAALPDEIGIDELTLMDSRSVEQTVAFANMETRAEAQYRTQLWVLQHKLEWLAQRATSPLSALAVAPPAICRAFQRACEALQAEFEIELLVYKLFERRVVGQLGPFYQEVLALLDRAGAPATSARARMPRPVAGLNGMGTGPGTPAAPPAAGGDPAYAPQAGGGGLPGNLDAQTFALLQQLAQATQLAPLDYTDAHLAADLAGAMQGRAVQGWPSGQSEAFAQRSQLIGAMFNELLDDPHLPADTKPELDRLRFSVIKSALVDSSFFTEPDHPVRRLVNELATIAATARDSGDFVGRIGNLVDELHWQIDEAPAAIRAAPAATAIGDEEAARFLDQQRQQSRTRRKAIIAKVRESVAAELRLRTAGLAIPETVRPLLAGGWSTMMAYHLIRENGAGFADGITLLDRVIQALDSGQPAARRRYEREELRTDLSDAMLGVGLPADRVTPMLDALEDALDGLGGESLPAAAGGVAISPEQADERAEVERRGVLLDLLLVSGRWFHVADRVRHERRWLKLDRGDAEGFVFVEYNGRNPLHIASVQALEDLLTRQLEPIDAPAAARQMLDTLIARRERG